jgi:PncC family amidohydrolase
MSARALADVVARTGRRVSVAESVSGGGLAAAIVATPGSGDWFAGGIVAYDSEIKYSCLGVRRGPVITATAAQEMALGACRIFGTEIGVATTGCAGPDSMEGQPVGTVWIGVAVEGVASAAEVHFHGDPAEIRDATIDRALLIATRTLQHSGSGSPMSG